MSAEKNSYNHQLNIREANLTKKEMDEIEDNIKHAHKKYLITMIAAGILTACYTCSKSIDVINRINNFKEAVR